MMNEKTRVIVTPALLNLPSVQHSALLVQHFLGQHLPVAELPNLRFRHAQQLA